MNFHNPSQGLSVLLDCLQLGLLLLSSYHSSVVKVLRFWKSSGSTFWALPRFIILHPPAWFVKGDARTQPVISSSPAGRCFPTRLLRLARSALCARSLN